MQVLKNYENRLLFALLALLILPVWCLHYFPTVDGPSHAANGVNLLRLITGACPLSQKFFHITPGPVPNYLSDIIFALLSPLLPAQISDKLVISICIIFFPLSIQKLIKSVRVENSFMVFPALLLGYNLMLFYGNYNFILSLIIAFYALSNWQNSNEKLGFKKWLKLFIIFNLLYFTHIFGFALFCLALASISICSLPADNSNLNFKRQIKIASFCLSAALLDLAFFYWYLQLPKTQIIAAPFPLPLKFGMGVMLTSLAVFKYDSYLCYSITFFIWLIFSLAALHRKRSRRKFTWRDYPLLLAAGLFCLILLAPPSFAGGWVIESRLQLAEFVFLLIWVSFQDIHSIERKVIIIFSSLCVIAVIALNLPEMREYDNILGTRERALTNLPADSTILFIDISPTTLNYQTNAQVTKMEIPYIQSYFTANNCAVEIANTHSSEKNIFPVSYKDSMQPSILGIFNTPNRTPVLPPQVNFKNYSAVTGVAIDYIVVFGDKNHLYNYDPDTNLNSAKLYKDFMHELEPAFTLYRTSPEMHWSIYKSKS